EVVGGVAEVAAQVAAGDPLCAGRNADAVLPHDRAGGVRAVPTRIDRLGRALPGVEPPVLVVAVRAEVGFAQRRVLPVRAAVRNADNDALAGHAELGPHPLRVDGVHAPG